MPQAPRTIRARAGSPEFGDHLYEQLRRAPWVLASLALHGAAFLVLMMLPPPAEEFAEAPPIFAAMHEPPPELLEDEPPPVPPVVPVEEPTDVEVTPIDVKNEVVSENPQDVDPSPVDMHSIQPWTGIADGPGMNSIIGIGPGGGSPGGRGGFGIRNLRGRVGGRQTEKPLLLALEWLKNHQSPDGRWDGDGFDAMCKLNKCDGAGDASHDVGLTGLALLPFLGAGSTHQNGEYKDTVKLGITYLRGRQDAEGCFGPRTTEAFQYDHACAALAMVEAYGMSGSRLLRDSAQRSVGFVQQSQNPYLAWRYGVRDGDNDTSVTGWMAMVLKSAQLAELEVDGGAMRGALGWVDRMTDPEFGRVGYQQRGGAPARKNDMMDKFPGDQSESLTAVGVLVRVFAGQDPAKEPAIQKGVDLMSKRLPRWDTTSGELDMYYWYYGTLAMFQVGGEPWKRWDGAMKTAIVDHQRVEPGRDELGSWDPVDPWSPEVGRVYSTSVLAVCLEVYYRYSRVVGLGIQR